MCQILRPACRPTHEFIRILHVEGVHVQHSVQIHLTALASHNGLAATRYPGFAFKNAQATRAVRVQPVQSLLHKFHARVFVDQGNRVGGKQFADFDDRHARQDAELRVGPAVGDHFKGAILTDAKNDARGEQHFRAPILRGQRLAVFHVRKFGEFRSHRLAVQGHLTFDVVNHARMG